MNKPKTFLDKEERTNSQYFFISYSHRDIETVYPLLDKLYENGVNYWYDVELDPGDKWNERVIKIIDDERCVGALLFLSENSLVSDAVNKEVDHMLPKQGDAFRLTSVILGRDKAKDLLFAVADKDDNFYNASFSKFNDLTRDGLWLTAENAVDDISKLAKKHNVTDKYTINTRNSYLSELPSRMYNGKRTYLCGKYRSDIEENTDDISWLLVERSGNEIVFVSEYCIDFVNFDEISAEIAKIKAQLSDKDYVADVKLINESFIQRHDDLTEALPTNYADKRRNQALRVFWVLKDDGENEEYCLYNALNVKINERIDYRRINAGLRLLLTVKNDKIRSD